MIRYNAIFVAAFFMVFSFFPVSCGTFNKTYPEKRLFSLDPDPALATITQGQAAPLLVKAFDIAPVFNTTAFVYRLDDSRFETDYFNEFIVPVSEMVTEEIQTSLIETALFVPYSRHSRPGTVYRLSGKIIRICGDFRDKMSPAAVIEVHVLFERWGMNKPETVISKHYLGKTSLKTTDPHGLVQGWNQGLGIILEALYQDLLDRL